MGVYQLHSEDEGQGRVYKQRHDDNGSFQSYLYRSEMHTNIHSRTDSILLLKWAILLNYPTAHLCCRVGQSWYVSEEIGLLGGYATFLKADAGNSSQTTPPLKGWQFKEIGRTTKWIDDPDMECGKPTLPCKAVTVELYGKSPQMKTVHFSVILF